MFNDLVIIIIWYMYDLKKIDAIVTIGLIT